jgi:SAM-dependent methyltransferase
MVRNSQFLYAETLASILPRSTRWLDLGCGHQVVPNWVPSDRIASLAAGLSVVGADGDIAALRQHNGLSLKVAANIERLPLAHASFDLVTANMVLEHVAIPTGVFAEVSRVLRPGGRFVVHTPNVHGYTTMLARSIPRPLRPKVAEILQGRRPEDVYPTHYRANSLSILRELAEAVSLRELDLRTVTSSAQLFRVPVAGWLENQWLRLISQNSFSRLRPCIIGVFEKPSNR